MASKRDLLRHIKMLCDCAEAVDTKLGNVEAQLQQLALERDKLLEEWLAKARVSPLPFVTNAALRAPKLHKVLVDGADVLPSLWRTRCGKRFGLWQFTRLANCNNMPERPAMQELLYARCVLFLVLLSRQQWLFLRWDAQCRWEAGGYKGSCHHLAPTGAHWSLISTICGAKDLLAGGGVG